MSRMFHEYFQQNWKNIFILAKFPYFFKQYSWLQSSIVLMKFTSTLTSQSNYHEAMYCWCTISRKICSKRLWFGNLTFRLEKSGKKLFYWTPKWHEIRFLHFLWSNTGKNSVYFCYQKPIKKIYPLVAIIVCKERQFRFFSLSLFHVWLCKLYNGGVCMFLEIVTENIYINIGCGVLFFSSEVVITVTKDVSL